MTGFKNHDDEIQAAIADRAKREACGCDKDDMCPDCHPDCVKCKGRGYIGFGLTCDFCQGMGTFGWTQSEIDNEHERRGEQAAQEGY